MKKLTISALLASALWFSATQAQAVIVYQQVDQLTGFWDFNSATPLADKFGHGYTLANSGVTFTAPTASVNGWLPKEFVTNSLHGSPTQVAQFSGGFFDLPGSLYTGGSFTFITAQRNDGGNAFETLLASSRFRYQNVGDTLQGGINSPGGGFGGPSAVTHDAWYFVALTYDNTTKGLATYAVTNSSVLGGPVMTGSAAGALGLSNMINLRIGVDGVSGIGGGDGFGGQMDFIGFHNGALTQAELQLALLDFVNGPALVPEPSTLALLSLGVIGMAVRARRRRRAAA